MIISDLNHLETVATTQNIEGGFDIKLLSPTTQANVAILGQVATSASVGLFAFSSASNQAYVYQSNVADS
ncbi:MAG: hypothetical protein ACRC8Y_03815 [Chroococcales cyanobacterium]